MNHIQYVGYWEITEKKKKENQFHNSNWQRKYSNLQNSNETTTRIDWHVSVSQKCMKPEEIFENS